MFLLVQLATHISKITARSSLSFGGPILDSFLLPYAVANKFFELILILFLLEEEKKNAESISGPSLHAI